MTTISKRLYWTESKRVLNGEVRHIACCCDLPAARRADCALVSGNKTPCRCACHVGAHLTPKVIS